MNEGVKEKVNVSQSVSQSVIALVMEGGQEKTSERLYGEEVTEEGKM